MPAKKKQSSEAAVREIRRRALASQLVQVRGKALCVAGPIFDHPQHGGSSLLSGLVGRAASRVSTRIWADIYLVTFKQDGPYSLANDFMREKVNPVKVP